MNRRRTAVFVLGLWAGAVLAAEPATQKVARLRVGIYDSRAVAIAFIGSPVYQLSDGKRVAEIMIERDRALAAGDRKRVGEIEAWSKARQEQLHKQGFSTAPVDDILEHIRDQIPDIAAAAGVKTIISRWDKAAIARYSSADLVDVTMALVRALEPSDRQLKAAVEIQKHPPIPLEQAGKSGD